MKVGHKSYRIGSKDWMYGQLERSRIGRNSLGSDRAAAVRVNRRLGGDGVEEI